MNINSRSFIVFMLTFFTFSVCLLFFIVPSQSAVIAIDFGSEFIKVISYNCYCYSLNSFIFAEIWCIYCIYIFLYSFWFLLGFFLSGRLSYSCWWAEQAQDSVCRCIWSGRTSFRQWRDRARIEKTKGNISLGAQIIGPKLQQCGHEWIIGKWISLWICRSQWTKRSNCLST